MAVCSACNHLMAPLCGTSDMQLAVTNLPCGIFYIAERIRNLHGGCWKCCVCLLQVEALAKTALTDAVEILVGGRSVVNKDITQKIEIRPETDRFLRLLEILGAEYENGKILIFVASQDQCDNLFRDLLKVWQMVTLLVWCDMRDVHRTSACG